jgi:hypothetical protein
MYHTVQQAFGFSSARHIVVLYAEMVARNCMVDWWPRVKIVNHMAN